jgi:RND family efflux transporter MFP subunit
MIPSTLGRPVVVATLAVAALAVMAGCRGRSEGAAAPEQSPAVEAVQARDGTVPLEEQLSGVVKAENHAAIRAEIEARVVEVFVQSGDRVRRGQPLVRLDDGTLREQLQQAEASVRLASSAADAARARVAEVRAQALRARALAAEGLVSAVDTEVLDAQLAGAQAAVARAEAEVEQARAAVDERRSAVGRTVIRSPVDGRVGQRNVEPGMLADASTVLFEVGNLARMTVDVPLTGEMLNRVRPGHPVNITSPALAEPIAAKLSRISPFLAADSFTTIGEIDVANAAGRLRPGMFVNAEIRYGESEPATLVPASALWEDPRTGARGVFVLSVGGAAPSSEAVSAQSYPVARRDVELLAEGRTSAAVSGIEAGEWVVVVGQHLLSADKGRARARAASWERVMRLQTRQREDLLDGFLEKQQRIARTQGAVPPSNEEFLGQKPGR